MSKKIMLDSDQELQSILENDALRYPVIFHAQQSLEFAQNGAKNNSTALMNRKASQRCQKQESDATVETPKLDG